MLQSEWEIKHRDDLIHESPGYIEQLYTTATGDKERGRQARIEFMKAQLKAKAENSNESI